MNKMLLVFSLLTSLFAQSDVDWETISSMNNVNDITYKNGLVICATNGGVFETDMTGGNLKRITNLDGLSSLSVNKTVTDDFDNIIFGNNEGIINLYNENSGTFTYLYELQGKQINGMIFQKDTLWVTADKGIGLFVYIGGAYHFIDYFVNFPVMPDRLSALTLYENRIWAATDKGLLSAPSDVSRYTLNDPANWSVYTVSSGLTDNNIAELKIVDDELWVGADAGLSVINEALQIRREANWGGLAANRIAVSSKGISYIASGRTLYRYDSASGKTLIKRFGSDIQALTADAKGELWIGLKNGGYYYSKWDYPKRTDGLTSNTSRFIIKDSMGRVWSSTGKYKSTAPGIGFSVKENGAWKSFDFGGSHWSALANSDVIYEDKNGNVFIGTWGGGLIILPKDESDFIYLHSYTNSGYMYLTTADSITTMTVGPNDEYQRGFFDKAEGSTVPEYYEVIGAINGDDNGFIWFANFNASNKKFLAAAPYDENGMLSLDKEKWQYFGNNDLLSRLKFGAINSIEFDDLNRVWLGTQADGVWILDYNKTLYDKTDDVVYKLGINENLFSLEIQSLAYDQNGIMWIGTKGGLNSVDIYSVSGQNRVLAYKHIGDEAGENGPLGNWINQVRVDAFNNKWVATSKGLSILPDYKSPWEDNAWTAYTVRNSGIVSNNVHSVNIDNKNGEVFIGTENGISVYRGTFAELKQHFSATNGGPNPFHINSGKSFIIINLMNNSIVKIYTLNGKLIRTLNVENNDIKGGRAIWDGYDDNRHPVSSGVYYYLAYTNEGESVTGKIAVIRD